MKIPLPLVAVVLLLAGCSSAVATPSPTPTPTFSYGASAASIASAVKSCTGVAEEPLASSAVGIASLASCSLGGKLVDFYSWKDADSQGEPDQMLSGLNLEIYYAAGNGWSAQAHLDGDIPGQQSIAEAVVKAIGGKVYHHEAK
jgi:uncharacterized protein YceK